MKCHFKMLLNALPAFAAVLFYGAATGHANTELQQQKPAVQAQAQEAEPEYSEDEYNAYDSAAKEPDPLKRGSMLTDFVQKYPKSKLMTYVDASYKALLFDCSNNKKYPELETLAEQWLKIHPNDFDTIARVAEAAEKLGHDEKCVECLLELYKMQPTGSMAYNIAQTYKKMKNSAKYLEWAATLFKYPEYESDFKLRLDLVQLYADAKDFLKAAEYARAALKSCDLVKQPSAEIQEQLRAVRRACHDIIGRSLIEQDKFAEAISAFQEALRAEKYGEGYYYIALCQRKQDKIDDAMLSYARAELQGGEVAPKAKEQLEQLYKALHNNTLIGIEKIYKKAKEQPETAAALR
jgi:tetratricopeptide (TPR) repeat protein